MATGSTPPPLPSGKFTNKMPPPFPLSPEKKVEPSPPPLPQSLPGADIEDADESGVEKANLLESGMVDLAHSNDAVELRKKLIALNSERTANSDGRKQAIPFTKILFPLGGVLIVGFVAFGLLKSGLFETSRSDIASAAPSIEDSHTVQLSLSSANPLDSTPSPQMPEVSSKEGVSAQSGAQESDIQKHEEKADSRGQRFLPGRATNAPVSSQNAAFFPAESRKDGESCNTNSDCIGELKCNGGVCSTKQVANRVAIPSVMPKDMVHLEGPYFLFQGSIREAGNGYRTFYLVSNSDVSPGQPYFGQVKSQVARYVVNCQSMQWGFDQAYLHALPFGQGQRIAFQEWQPNQITFNPVQGAQHFVKMAFDLGCRS